MLFLREAEYKIKIKNKSNSECYKFLSDVKDVKLDDYYVRMMIAWYLATGLAKNYDDFVKAIEEKWFDSWTHNKAVQKAVESYRVSDEHKTYLKTLKVK